MTYGTIQFSGLASGGPAIGHGWNQLPLGAGGLVTGMHIANDGSMVCRTDVGNIYRWSGKNTDYSDPTKKWLSLLNLTSLGGSASISGGNDFGGWEHVLAPGNSAVHLAIFTDMTNVAGKSWLWYSTNSGGTWNQTNLSFLNWTAASNAPPGGSNDSHAPMGGNVRTSYYKIAIDPANSNVAYCGVPYDVSNVLPGAYTSLNKAGGSSLATWTSVKTSGATPVPNIGVNTLSCGIAIDPSLGTTPIGGQTVTKHIYLPIGGSDIYESVDGGNTFVSTGAAAAFGSANFSVTNGGCNSAGVYYALVCFYGSAGSNSAWRYIPTGTAGTGTWTNITPAAYTGGNIFFGASLIIDPRSGAGNQSYLSITGPQGVGAGFTSTNANSGTPSWQGFTGGENTSLLVASYDIPYLNYIFGQGAGFTYCPSTIVDLNGVGWSGGNQSLWYYGISALNSAPVINASTGPINYASGGGAGINNYWWSMGRGQEATVGIDIMVPPGGTYPITGPQDIGAPLRGTFTTYPQDLGIHFQEYQCSSIEYAASDPSFVVACVTYQSQPGDGSHYVYSTNYGADTTWIQPSSSGSPSMPDALWNPAITTTMAPVSGVNILTVASLTPSGGQIFVGQTVTQFVNGNGVYYGRIQAYGTSSTTGVGKTGTYALDTGPIATPAAPALTPSGSGGSLATGTVFVKVTIVNVLGETLASTEASVGVTGPSAKVVVTSPAYPGGSFVYDSLGYNVYSSSTTGTEKLNSGGPIAIGANFTITSLGAGASVPGSNTTGNLASTTVYSVSPFQGGQVVAVDHDKWIACPMGNAGNFVPAYTINATSGSATWALTSGLPATPWTAPAPFPWSFAYTSKAFCVGYGTDAGTVWAVSLNASGTATLYRSTSPQAFGTFSAVATFTASAAPTSVFIYAVPGFPDELWISGSFSGGSPVGLWHVTGARTAGTPTVTLVATPVAFPFPLAFSLGAPSSGGGYPAVYFLGNNGFGTAPKLHQGTTSGSGSSMTIGWAPFGATGTNADMPSTIAGQLPGFKFIRADPNVYQRLYASVGQSGYAYYNP